MPDFINATPTGIIRTERPEGVFYYYNTRYCFLEYFILYICDMKSFLKPNLACSPFLKSVVLACWVIVIACCNKPPVQPVPPPTVLVPVNHTITLKWITAYPTVKVHYTYPSSQQSMLISKEDTISNTYSISYQYEQGIPNPYSHYLDGNCINSTSDSIEVQIWIDGVLKASAKDMNYVDLNYMY